MTDIFLFTYESRIMKSVEIALRREGGGLGELRR
jgi:hypothetical protein